jgi:hemoglobin
MKKDIENKADIELLINSFYDKVKQDKTIGFIFNDIIGTDWSHHLPVMYRFWESILFTKPGYEGNPVKKHIDIDKRIALEQQHFDKWLAIWNETTDELFEGANAAQAKNRAMLMANLINIKVKMARSDKFIQ